MVLVREAEIEGLCKIGEDYNERWEVSFVGSFSCGKTLAFV
jgi:hypothetical protein